MPRQIPQSVAEVLDAAREFEPAVIAAIKKFRRAKPWRGTEEERVAKFSQVLADLAAAYEMPAAPALKWVPNFPASRAGFNPPTNQIILAGKLSVISLLHSFCIARGQRPYECFAWSLNLFARYFPQSFARARADGPNLFAGE